MRHQIVIPTITTLFLDLGSVLLTDSWSPEMRQKAVEVFGFDVSEVAKRSQLSFEVYEDGKTSLDEYLHHVVFNTPQSFTLEDVKEFMLSASQPHPEMIELIRGLKARYGLRVAVITNDGREFFVRRVQQFKLTEFIDFFVASCFVHCRKPDPEIYRLALDIGQVQPEQAVYIDDQALFVEVAQEVGIQGIHHTSYKSTRATLEALGLVLESRPAFV